MNLDRFGRPYKVSLFFKISSSSLTSQKKVTIHTHHSTRLIQGQGGSMMSDQSTAALWFVNYVIFPKFTTMASAKKFDIEQLNKVILAAGQPMQQNTEKCSFCFKGYDARCKPTQCSKWLQWLYKISCSRDHRCSASTIQLDNQSHSVDLNCSTSEALQASNELHLTDGTEGNSSTNNGLNNFLPSKRYLTKNVI